MYFLLYPSQLTRITYEEFYLLYIKWSYLLQDILSLLCPCRFLHCIAIHSRILGVAPETMQPVATTNCQTCDKLQLVDFYNVCTTVASTVSFDVCRGLEQTREHTIKPCTTLTVKHTLSSEYITINNCRASQEFLEVLEMQTFAIGLTTKNRLKPLKWFSYVRLPLPFKVDSSILYVCVRVCMDGKAVKGCTCILSFRTTYIQVVKK